MAIPEKIKNFMNLSSKIEVFSKLKQKIENLTDDELVELSATAKNHNGWFTHESVKNALGGIAFMLEEDKLKEWTSKYELKTDVPKIVGIVMAGNIPLVGFHDLLCVLLSGHFVAIKPSSDDEILTRTIVEWILEIEPKFKKNIEIKERLNNVDAVIATGSDNTARYFEYYFRNVPNIIRKNRTSVAVLNGKESAEDIQNLGLDIFSYYGLGCRNVSKIYTPKGFDLRDIFPHLEQYNSVANHHKYRNNYDYHKSIYLVNQTPHLDTGFLLAISTDDLVSPISVLFHQEYESLDSLTKILDDKKEKIQCIVGEGYIPFGKAQRPELWDYADDVDVMEFLSNLN